MRAMCVVHITSSFSLSGGTRQSFLLAQGLKEAGHRIVFCAPDGSPVLRLAAENGLETFALSFDGARGQWLGGRRLRRIVRQVGARIVHAHHTKGHNVALLATFGGGFPPVVANRGVLFRPRFPAKFKSPRTAAIITNSHAVRRVLEGCGVPGRKIHVVYNAAPVVALSMEEHDLDRLRRELGLGGGPVVGAVGSARPEKGFQYLVEAAPAILEAVPEAEFVLVGGGTERFRDRLKVLGVGHAFRLTGYRNDVTALMKLFDLFVIPSVDMDSCPNVLLEAMLTGLPAVGAATGGIPEMIEDGRSGVIVPPADPAALAASVVQLLTDRGRLRRMGTRAREIVEKRFSLKAKLDSTLRVYEKVLGQCYGPNAFS